MRKSRKGYFDGVNPEDAFLDSSNLPGYDFGAAEGKIVKPLSTKEVYTIGFLFVIILIIFTYRSLNLQLLQGSKYRELSQNNTLSKSIIFAERGVITDRFGTELAWNEPHTDAVDFNNMLNIYSLRKYINQPGLSHLLGYVSYPIADKSGYWWRTDFVPNAGIELSLGNKLRGENGYKLIEVNALGDVISSGSIEPPIDGENITLTIDRELATDLYNAIKEGADIAGFQGGAGVIMDIDTGEVLAITSYPEYDSNILTDATDRETISKYAQDPYKPFLNRAVQGSYTPGSIIKPYVGAVALQEGIITENTKILSTGVLKVPNKYNPGQYTIFRDWRTGLGLLDIREAIKMSSSIFFYIIGGGHEQQPGLGITKIAKWGKIFGFGELTGITLPGEIPGLVPTPNWQKETFGDDSIWRLGNTYHSAIGQYGWLVTPIQAAQYISSIANGGRLNSPILILGTQGSSTTIPIDKYNLQIIREGMRMGAQSGTAQALNINGIEIAAKTGTAQLGRGNEFMNSWVVGFWPYDNPKYAFAIVLEKAKADTLRGAAPAMRPFFEKLLQEHSQDYIIGKYPNIDSAK
jgi:penicillin-binding protein 2